jgi:protein SCO1
MKYIANYSIMAGGKALFSLIIFGITLLAGCAEKKAEFRSVDITGAEHAQDFALPDVNGQTKTIADFKGKAVVLFFGFAQCPDVCPTTMAEVAAAKKSLGKDADKVTAIFITVDPERDTPQVLKSYMESFDPTSYTIDHTAASFVYDPQGKIRLYTRYGMGAQALAEDLKILLR